MHMYLLMSNSQSDRVTPHNPEPVIWLRTTWTVCGDAGGSPCLDYSKSFDMRNHSICLIPIQLDQFISILDKYVECSEKPH